MQMRIGLQTAEDGFGTSTNAGEHGRDHCSIYGVQLVPPSLLSCQYPPLLNPPGDLGVSCMRCGMLLDFAVGQM